MSEPRARPGQPRPLGATRDGRGTTFAVCSKLARRVELRSRPALGRHGVLRTARQGRHAAAPRGAHRPARHLRGTCASLASEASIAHLKRLGVTAVELLPVHAFVDDDRLARLGPTLSFEGPCHATCCRLGPADRRYFVDYAGAGNTVVVRTIIDSLRQGARPLARGADRGGARRRHAGKAGARGRMM